jgi:hypothetical protein
MWIILKRDVADISEVSIDVTSLFGLRVTNFVKRSPKDAIQFVVP